jgi:hypothetical protein
VNYGKRWEERKEGRRRMGRRKEGKRRVGRRRVGASGGVSMCIRREREQERQGQEGPEEQEEQEAQEPWQEEGELDSSLWSLIHTLSSTRSVGM